MSRDAFPVVGIGSSAGGVQALQKFFDQMPADSGMAIVVVPHLDPTESSHMVEVLASHTDMEVVTAEKGQKVEADIVYVIPPDRYLTFYEGRIDLVQPREARGHRRPIDVFFTSLGSDLKQRAVAIVLSGTGTNGAAGLRTVKGEGGFVLAQDPQTAEFSDMPRAAIDTGLVDEVLAPQDLPAALLRFSQHAYFNKPEPDGIASEANLVTILLSLLRARTRHDFRSYKRSTILRRIHRRMGLKGLDKLADYVDKVRSDEEESKALALDFMITVTGFFRDEKAWKALEDLVIKPLIEAAGEDRSVRVWVPACATGEEAYSIGMLLLDGAKAAERDLEFKIFATNTSNNGLEFARNGLYPLSIASDVPERFFDRYFDTRDHTCQVVKKLRDIVVFAPQNVLQDPPFTRVDLVSCRNLLIYLEQDVQQKLLKLLHFALRENGHLFLGSAETITGKESLFEPVSKKWRVYRRTGLSNRTDVDFPVIREGDTMLRSRWSELESYRPRRKLADIARDALLAEFAPAAVVVDRNYRIFYFHGDTDQFLRQPGGEPTDDLMSLIRDGLRAQVRASMESAVDDDKPVAATTRMRRGGQIHTVTIEVRPLRIASAKDGLFILSFQISKDAVPCQPLPGDHEDASSDTDVLEHENRVLRDELRSTVEQMDSSNEELKASSEEILSMNEELQSANEELETSKEELQSFNEEPNTVNAQLQTKLEDLEEKTNDLDNLLRSTNVGTIFLDRQLQIRWFSPSVEDLVDVLPTDIGRPLEHLRHKIEGGDLTGDAKQVLRTLMPVSAEVVTKDGSWFVRDTLPYRTQEDRIEGVVLTFTEVTELKRAEEHLRRERDYSRRALDAVRQPVLVLDRDHRVTMVNQPFLAMFARDEDSIEGQNIFEIDNDRWDIPELRRLLEKVVPNHAMVDRFELDHAFSDQGASTMLLNVRRLDDVGLIFLSIEDITERKRSERQRETLIAELNHRVKNSLATVKAIAGETARTSDTLADFQAAFDGRLMALSRGHDLLTRGNWQPTGLDTLINHSLSPYAPQDGRHFEIECDGARVVPQAALAFDLILHELATNSAKYGALANGKGLVNITCEMQNGKKPRLIWRETGGPIIEKRPNKKGFGTKLIERSAMHDLDGKARLEYRREGLCCTITYSRKHVATND